MAIRSWFPGRSHGRKSFSAPREKITTYVRGQILKRWGTRRLMLSGTVLLCLLSEAAAAQTVTIPAENLKAALDDYIKQSGIQLIYSVDDLAGMASREVHDTPADDALLQMLGGTALSV